jgi:hypothetical protein
MAINLWSYHWQQPATRQKSEIIDSFYCRWGETTALWQIETEGGVTLEDLLEDLVR